MLRLSKKPLPKRDGTDHQTKPLSPRVPVNKTSVVLKRLPNNNNKLSKSKMTPSLLLFKLQMVVNNLVLNNHERRRERPKVNKTRDKTKDKTKPKIKSKMDKTKYKTKAKTLKAKTNHKPRHNPKSPKILLFKTRPKKSLKAKTKDRDQKEKNNLPMLSKFFTPKPTSFSMSLTSAKLSSINISCRWFKSQSNNEC